MFPSDFDINKIVDLTTSTKTTVKTSERVGREFAFDFKNNRFIMTDGRNVETSQIDSIATWVERFIRTENDKFKIYSSAYGVNLNNLIGYRLPQALKVARIEKRITEGILNLCPKTVSVHDWTFNNGRFEFTVRTNTGEERRLKYEISI